MTQRHVLVTGAAGGIGAACAAAFAAQGDNVTGVDARADELSAQLTELADKHDVRTLALTADPFHKKVGSRTVRG